MEFTQNIERPAASIPALIALFPDGSCLGNPGPGGAAAVLEARDADGNTLFTHEVGKSFPEHTTNNQMELWAAILGLRAIKKFRQVPVNAFLDSQYVAKGMTEWRQGWEAKGWKTADGKPVKNRDLWLALIEAADVLNITWVHVKGHAGNPGNERADKLAGEYAKKAEAEYRANWGRA